MNGMGMELKNLEWLTKIVDNSQVGIVVTDLNRKVIYVNDYLAELIQFSKDEIISNSTRAFHVDDEKFQTVGRYIQDMIENDTKKLSLDYEILSKYGKKIHINASGHYIKEYKQMLWILVDITKTVETQKELKELNYNLNQYLDAIDKINLGLFVVSKDFEVEYMNKTMIKWFGNQVGKTCYKSVAGLDEPCSYCKLADVVEHGKKVLYDPTTPDGQTFDIVAVPVRNMDGTVSKMEIIKNITEELRVKVELEKQQYILEYQTQHDELTGLPNRLLLTDRLDQAIQRANREKNKAALFFIDLDYFKEINESFGHDIGDMILQNVATLLSSVLRKKDTLARFSGDEFAIVIEDLGSIQDITLLAKKILDVFAKPIELEDRTFYVSASMGISISPDDASSAQNLLRYADSAMYKAKNDGRNNFQFYSAEMTEIAFEKIVMEASLRAAIQDNDFVVYYQPQVDGKDGTIVGMEALVRWNHQNMGIVSPDKFIPIAEASGLIVDIDKFVMREAMTQISNWYKAGLNPGKVAINLSVKQLQRDDFIDVLKEIMKESGCKAEWLELEVTEGQIMKNPDEAIKILQQIRDLGIELAVDDFGTGYSSLSYLKKLPINKLKIDQSFVRSLPNDVDDVAIVEAVIALAKSLKLHTIAEGVEVAEQKDFIIKNGCDFIQGFYYSRPIPAVEFEKKLKKGFKK